MITTNIIVQQPDGKYAVWSKTLDTFTILDCTAEEAISYVVGLEARATRSKLRDQVARGILLMNWQQCITRYKTRYGQRWSNVARQRDRDKIDFIDTPTLRAAIERAMRLALGSQMSPEEYGVVFGELSKLLRGWDPSWPREQQLLGTIEAPSREEE